MSGLARELRDALVMLHELVYPSRDSLPTVGRGCHSNTSAPARLEVIDAITSIKHAVDQAYYSQISDTPLIDDELLLLAAAERRPGWDGSFAEAQLRFAVGLAERFIKEKKTAVVREDCETCGDSQLIVHPETKEARCISASCLSQSSASNYATNRAPNAIGADAVSRRERNSAMIISSSKLQ